MPRCVELLAVFEFASDLGANHIHDIGKLIEEQRTKIDTKFEMNVDKLKEYVCNSFVNIGCSFA
jgi:hypothetical protein